MPPTLAAVAALPQLALRPLTGPPPAAPVTWVAVSELEDPTPFLEGGELVLTTGMRLAGGDAAGYVARLVARGVAGLGFGVGLGHAAVPAGLLDAARAQGLALLEVPRATPFVAIGKAVSQLLADERLEDVTRAYQAQRALTRAALDGPGALAARLGRLLGAWVLLLDADGAVRHAHGAGEAEAAALAPELPRLRDGAAASVAVGDAGGHVAVQRIGLGRRPRGYLAIGTAAPLPQAAHGIAGAAVALLTLASETPGGERELRAALAALLLGLPGGPSGPLRVLACAAGAVEALDGTSLGARCLVLPRGDHAVVVAPDAAAGRVAALLAADGPVGVSEVLADGGTALAQAEETYAAARRGGAGVLHHRDLPGQGVLALMDPGAARAFADALLAPLRAAGPDLVPSLRAYVQANGQGEAAARALGVHRHTLRARMQRAAALLGRDPDDPAARAELWIALAVTPDTDAVPQ
ncbi:PucR family transcriptional regulator [Actinomadura parmotrematis]|uniref:PucR family transcriptional regulator n=1 Tax=Actinomadura parmotrematis TaxID=2864039 RepID=A0ABS7G234_9ACTN|nr:PucR family transcriptional regulator [Actinomadura parmotrematis]MBW8486772.1 PucR family transcriptional regulator [Actinomadura parmotrematis]